MNSSQWHSQNPTLMCCTRDPIILFSIIRQNNRFKIYHSNFPSSELPWTATHTVEWQHNYIRVPWYCACERRGGGSGRGYPGGGFRIRALRERRGQGGGGGDDPGGGFGIWTLRERRRRIRPPPPGLTVTPATPPLWLIPQKWGRLLRIIALGWQAGMASAFARS